MIAGIPLEVIPSAYSCVRKKLKLLGAHCVLRQAGSSKAGPVVTDNGNFIIDANFGVIEPSRVDELDRTLNCMCGIVETGLFVNMAQLAYFGGGDGTVQCRKNDIAQAMGLYTTNNTERKVFGSLHNQ